MFVFVSVQYEHSIFGKVCEGKMLLFKKNIYIFHIYRVCVCVGGCVIRLIRLIGCVRNIFTHTQANTFRTS